MAKPLRPKIRRPDRNGTALRTRTPPPNDDALLAAILSLVRHHDGHDFSGYRRPLLLRRVQRRQSATGAASLDAYARLVRKNPAESAALAAEIVAGHGVFFRDPAAWERLRRKVIAPLVAARPAGAVLRAWVAGCAGGEEAYSLAMLLLEAVERAGKNQTVKLFATDLAEASLQQARRGAYTKSAVHAVPARLLERYFECNATGFRVRKNLREVVVFARHDLLQDPPFPQLDLCACRNLLHHLQPATQARTLATLHFGLKDDGALFLGPNESATANPALFQAIDESHRIFARRPAAPSLAAPALPASGQPLNEAQADAAQLGYLQREIVGINQELQSTNDQLAAGKAELQSLYAESAAVNAELQALNAELTAVNARLEEKMRELQGTTDDLSGLLNSIDIAVLFLDRELRLQRFTPAIGDLLPLTPADVGRPFTDLPRRFTDVRLLGDVQTVLAELNPLEAEIISESGRAYLRRVLPYRTVDHQLEGAVITFTDITRRKLAESALRSSEERHRFILDGVAEYVIVMLDQEGRFATWTATAEQILGFRPSEAIGQRCTLLSTPEDRANGVAERELKEAMETGSSRTERWHVRRDGSRFWGTGTISALRDESNRLYGFVKVLRDNTDRRRQEELLKQAKEAAERANAAKDNFLANVSHELRTPLATTLLWAKLLTGQKKLDPAQFREGIETIEKSARDQQALIEDLMDMSRIVAGKLRLEVKPTELETLLRNAIESIRTSAVEHGVAIEEKIDPNLGTVRADPLRLQQVVWNLLSNAVKFTPADGRITVRAARHGDQVEIVVTDTGQGIDQDFLPHLFDRFSQVEETTFRTSGGLGLGLSISRQLVELHGGTIAAHSDGPGKGAAFTVRLPLPALSLEPDPAPRPAPSRHALRGVQVLLVEDSKETRKALTTVLTEAGATVVPASSAQRALEEFNRQRPDLILSDIGLGKISGHELIGQIRQWEKAQKSPPVPAMALTAYADRKNRETAFKSGFMRCLTKPIDPAELVATLAELHEAR